MTFTSPILLFIAVLIALGIFVLAWIRRPALPGVSLVLAGLGVVAMTLAAGAISCRRGDEKRIAVMVDLSPSTRGASFRDAKWLRSRIHELVGPREFDLYGFSDTTRRIGDDDALNEMRSDQTSLLPPPQTQAVLLFSDGRLDTPPVIPPVYAVIDPALDHPTDAAVVDLEERGNQLAASVRNDGNARVLSWVDRQRQPATAPSGTTVITTRLVTNTEPITARLAPGDAWPENDALSIRPSPAIASQRWWIGDAPPRGWTSIAPGNLPLDSAAWLGPAIIVLNNLPADDLSPQQQDRLQQYVRDLGGALVIAGGDRAFGAGHYQGSDLESLSPLASSPPEPATHWVMLLDSSGSMSNVLGGPAGNASRFKVAGDALLSVLHDLPKADLVSIGSFARDLRWWSAAKSVQDTLLQKLPPTDVQPQGPTNLEKALQQTLEALPASPPIDLLVVSDAEAELTNAESLAVTLKERRVRVHALVIGASKPDSPLQRIVSTTGGQFVQQGDAQQWAASVKRLLRATMPDRTIRQPVTVSFTGTVEALASRSVNLLNRTWLKRGAMQLAEAIQNGEKLPAAARWTVGSGDVLAIAFTPTFDEIGAIERAIARKPRDPRFGVQWRTGATLHVRIDARSGSQFLNDQPLSIEFGNGPARPIPQTAPGRYEIDLPGARSPATVTILNGQAVLDRFAVAGRYPKEFDQLGNDIEALSALADRSGGKVIAPTQHAAIDFPETRELQSIAAWFAILGVLLIAGSLVWWRVT